MITHWDNVKCIWVSMEPQDILNLLGLCVLQLFWLVFSELQGLSGKLLNLKSDFSPIIRSQFYSP